MSIIGSFFGGDQRKDIRNASAKATKELDTGYAGANDYYNQAYGLYEPYAQQGQADQTTYRNALGLGTQAEQQAAQERYLSDPMQQAQLGQASNQLLRNLNAKGAGAGVQALGASRVASEQYGGWLNRLQGLGQQGLQVAGAQSGVRQGQGDLRWNLAGSKAGNAINTGSAIANSRTQGVNNLLGAIGTGVRAAALF